MGDTVAYITGFGRVLILDCLSYDDFNINIQLVVVHVHFKVQLLRNRVTKSSILGKSLLVGVTWMDFSVQGQMNSVCFSLKTVLLLVHFLDL